jgi:hypothetical protein
MESHVARFNEGVRSGDWEPMLAAFADDAELRFENVPPGRSPAWTRSGAVTSPSRPTTRSGCSVCRTM